MDSEKTFNPLFEHAIMNFQNRLYDTVDQSRRATVRKNETVMEILM